jgi:hypothetical protein
MQLRVRLMELTVASPTDETLKVRVMRPPTLNIRANVDARGDQHYRTIKDVSFEPAAELSNGRLCTKAVKEPRAQFRLHRRPGLALTNHQVVSGRRQPIGVSPEAVAFEQKRRTVTSEGRRHFLAGGAGTLELSKRSHESFTDVPRRREVKAIDAGT